MTDQDIPPLEDCDPIKDSAETPATPQSVPVRSNVNGDKTTDGGINRELQKRLKEKTKDGFFPSQEEDQTATQQNEMGENRCWNPLQDLTEKMAASPEIQPYLEDGQFLAFLSKLQKDPNQALLELERNPHLNEIFKKCAEVMGDYFTKLGVKQAQEEAEQTKPRKLIEEVHSSTTRRVAGLSSSSSDERIEKLLDNKDIREALVDPTVIELVDCLHKNPNKAQHIAMHASPDVQRKLRILIESGILAVKH
ncbi:unnamed protein product [Calicophoron daubneyi]|uniref:STI1/HOP DP domain-containing protein n=1 Tax=Calicophoron daubneyi TaxID=300641 RepID=A0AAV2T6P9_CALDB